MKKLILIIAAGALLALAGCGSQTPEEATAEFCSSLEAFDTSVQQLEQITSSNTVGELEQARDNVADAWQQVTRSAEDLAEVRVDSIEDAWKNLERTVSDVSSRDTIADAAASIAAGAAQTRAAVAGVGSASCPELDLSQEAGQATAVDQQESPDAAAPALAQPAESSVAGAYTGQIPSSNGAEQTMTLTLHPNGEASMVFGSADEVASQADEERIVVGSWSENADGTVGVTLDRLQNGTELALAETFVFTRQDGQLVAVEYNAEVYGPSGLTLVASAQVTAGPEASAVITSTVSGVITDTSAAPLAETGSAQPSELTQTVWQLQQMTQGSAVTVVSDPSLYTLVLAEDGMGSATADCSTASGPYQVDGSSISFELIWSTAGCAQTSLARQFANYLEYANAFQVQGEALVIYFNNSSGQMLFAAGQ